MFFDMQAERASFCHNGEKIALIPEQMTAAGEGVYEKTLPDGRFEKIYYLFFNYLK